MYLGLYELQFFLSQENSSQSGYKFSSYFPFCKLLLDTTKRYYMQYMKNSTMRNKILINQQLLTVMTSTSVPQCICIMVNWIIPLLIIKDMKTSQSLAGFKIFVFSSCYFAQKFSINHSCLMSLPFVIFVLAFTKFYLTKKNATKITRTYNLKFGLSLCIINS